MGIHILSDKKLEHLIAERVEVNANDAERHFERDILMKQANIQLLQSQINPHFLYNTLECIRAQAILDGSEQIANTAQALSRFFRYSINSKSDIVSIKDELANIDNYVIIQQYRFRGRFEMVTDEMDNSIQFASIPKLSLQPIIENAIIHGFSDTRSGGLIRISASHVINNCISVRVQDNGKGMDAAKLEQLCDKINAPSLVAEQPGVRQSIGLWNVNRRIKLMYGEKYGMTLYSTPNIGTTVELFFPFQSVEKV